MTIRRSIGRVTRALLPTGRVEWRTEILAATMILAEAAVVYVYAGALFPTRSAPYHPFPALVVASLMLVAYAVPRLLEAYYVRSVWYEVVLGLSVSASLLVLARITLFPTAAWLDTDWVAGSLRSLIFRPSAAERPAWGVVVLGGYAWWRGRTRGEPSLEGTYELLRWGSVALAAGLVLALVASPLGGTLRPALPATVVWFVSAALAAIAQARLRLEALRSSGPLGGVWLLAVGGALVVVVGLAVVLAGLADRNVLETIWLALWPVFWLIGLLLRAVVLVLAVATFIVILPILWFLERHGLGRSLGEGRAGWLFDSLTRLHEVARLQVEVADPVRYLLALFVLSTVLSWLVRWVARRRRRWRVTTSEEREPVPVGPPSLAGLRKRWRRLLRRGAQHADALAALRADPRWRYTLEIRLAYRWVLRSAARAGVVRRAGQTPREYATVLRSHLPDAAPAVDELTELYQLARYRPVPAAAETATRARRAAHSVTALLWERRRTG